MRIALLILLLLAPVGAQNSNRTEPKGKSCGCSPTPAILYRPIVHAMWERDEGEHPNIAVYGYIRVAVHPAWDGDFFLDVRLNRNDPPTIVTHSLPKGAKTLRALIEKALKANPCADATTLATALPMEKRTFTANERTRDLIAQFFTLRFAAKPESDIVRLDATEYEMEFVGDSILAVNSDDDEAPIVKWLQSLVSVVNEGSPRDK